MNKINNKHIIEIKKNVQKYNYNFITIENIKNNENNNKLINNFGKAYLVDVNIRFQKKIININLKKDININFKNNLKTNIDIINISKNSFTYSRFYTDKKIKNGNKVHEQWVKNAFNNKNKIFCYYEQDKKVIGYILFTISKLFSTIFIELIAVDINFRNKGIGTKLINALEIFALNNGINFINVGTQLNNINAQNFYIKNKFVHIANNSIYHWWEE